jgi:hypothetical protein
METPMVRERDNGVVGLVIADDTGGFFAIGWDDLRPYRVPAAVAAAVAALVRGEEPAGRRKDVAGAGGTIAPAGMPALLIEAAELGDRRLAAQRLEAWALLR